ncbi:uncharacterized protein Z518_08595 [Rhinocladiella mackenziei CBS 650.93]|uniref:Uncharacterized protein n=1 Tax=Rhinocladiella mackenziei CBS 650.93 TaxID=1442369 RepID=A0A0D2GWP6_9EURO|nr:uncharacterized protein Z518_08595 [Rhinocladiella mackenziei CBS 650.93]KIX02653.1 hypothetical protein Z518_08595 [Rhinocladiella mackenziei CBS 650.93]
MTLVKAIAVNTVTPELAAWRGEPKSKRTTAWSLDNRNLRGLLSPSSVNEELTPSARKLKRQYRSPGRLMAYLWKHAASGSSDLTEFVWLEHTSMVTPLMAVLFCSGVSLGPHPRLILNEWLSLAFSIQDDSLPGLISGQSARIMLELRKTIDRFISLAWNDLEALDQAKREQSEHLPTPSKQPSFPKLFDSKLRRVMVDAVVRMLDEDEAFWKDFREKQRAKNIAHFAKAKENENALYKIDDGPLNSLQSAPEPKEMGKAEPTHSGCSIVEQDDTDGSRYKSLSSMNA